VKDNIKPEGSQYDILLIEYDLATIRLLTSYFESKGVTCKGVVTGTKGLEDLEHNHPKVVLLTLEPTLTAYDICKWIKSNRKLKHIPVFFLPSIPGSEVEKHLAETKADGYILKPFSFSDFDGILDLLRPNSVKEDLPIEIIKRSYPKVVPTAEKHINQYITLKLENGKTYIYVNGKRFIQCIRLILNIQKEDIPIYDEIESIDEAAKVYKNHIYQNRIVTGPGAVPVRDQSHDIAPEQEFWGHCSNLQAWVENDYDTRLLMSNLSFPLLRELTRAGDPIARRVFKEEIALRLESRYPPVVQYLLIEGFIDVFTPSEFKSILKTTGITMYLSSSLSMLDKFLKLCLHRFTPSEFKSILEATDIIKNLSTSPGMLIRFIRSCHHRFPTLLENILRQISELKDVKKKRKKKKKKKKKEKK